MTEDEPKEDILIIADKLLKQAMRVKTHATLKSIMTLTAVIVYVKLYRQWKNTGARKRRQPAKSASMAIAARMGKGSSFARQIRQMVPYILEHRRLPDRKKYQRSGGGSLLDNEAIVAGVRRHLAEHKLGEVSCVDIYCCVLPDN